MGTKSSKWNIIWMFHVFTVKASAGLTSRLGEIQFKPASAVIVGSNVSVICSSATHRCNGNFFFRVNNEARSPHSENQTSATIQLIDVRRDYYVTCSRKCNGFQRLVDESVLHVGYHPDKPRDITCSREESSIVMSCKWNPGQKTLIHTYYTVHIINLQTGAESTVRRRDASVTIPVTDNGSVTIQVIAENQLSSSESDLVHVKLSDIVIPSTPVITNISKLGSNLNILISWRNWSSESQRYCELQYNTPGERDWAMIGEKININNSISINKIRKLNSLRIRCREQMGNSYWSSWSDPYVMPPSGPEESPNVWRVIGPDHPNGTREVTILIRPDLDDLFHHTISGYKVYYLNNGAQTLIQTCPSSGVQCDVLLPVTIKTVFISAYNPYGISPASDISIQETAGAVLPEPQNVTVLSGLLTSVPVHWQHPRSSEESLQWFIIQWTLESCDGKRNNISWWKVGERETHFNITDNISAGTRVTASVYAVYSSGVSRPATAYGYSQEFEPNTGPKLEKDQQDARLVRWSEIPLCDRRGFITGYLLRQKTDQASKEERIPASARQYVLDGFNQNELHPVCISALTSAGEGPSDHCTLIQQDKSLHNYLGLLLGIGFGGIFLAALMLTLSVIQKRLKTVIILCLPKYLCEDYPRADNSAAVRSLQAAEEDPHPISCLPYNDPEIIEIQELLLNPTPSPPTPSMECTTSIQERGVEDKPPCNPTTSDHIAEPSGYRPQVANNHRYDAYCSPSHMLDVQRGALRAGGSAVTPAITEDSELRHSEDETTLNILKEFGLSVVDDVGDEDSSPPNGDDCTLQLDWEGRTVVQTPSSNPLLCTLPRSYEEFYATHPYFPQMFAKGQ